MILRIHIPSLILGYCVCYYMHTRPVCKPEPKPEEVTP